MVAGSVCERPAAVERNRNFAALVCHPSTAPSRVRADMRGLLIALALFAPIVLANPIFWWLVQANHSAAPVTAIEADGRVQQALLGPKSPWPDWALSPDDATLTVEAWFAYPPAPMTGFGTLKFKGDAATGVRAFVAKLEAAGWTVETARSDTVDPVLPPRPFQMCQLRATRKHGEPYVMSASVPLGYAGISARQHWWSAPPEQFATWPPLSGPPC